MRQARPAVCSHSNHIPMYLIHKFQDSRSLEPVAPKIQAEIMNVIEFGKALQTIRGVLFTVEIARCIDQ